MTDTTVTAQGDLYKPLLPPLGYPSLVRHLVYWDTEGKGIPARVDVINKYIDLLVICIRRKKHIEDIEILESSPVLSTTRGQCQSISFVWNGVKSIVSFSLYSEYATMTCSLDFSIKTKKSNFLDLNYDRSISKRPRQFDLNYISSILRDFPNIKENIDIQQCSTELFASVWGNFHSDIIDPFKYAIKERGRLRTHDVRMLGKSFGTLIGDYRGIITGFRKFDGCVVDDLFAEPYRCGPHERWQNRNYKCGRDEWHVDVIDKLKPFISADPLTVDQEFAANLAFNRQAFYISALGPPRRDRGGSLVSSPICFLIHFCTDDPWNIARGVETFLRLGTLRKVALIELNSIYQANPLIDAASKKCQNIIAEIFKVLNLKNELDQQEELNQIASCISSSSSNFDEIDQILIQINEKFAFNKNLDGHSIEFRLDRGHYYIDRFYKVLEILYEEEIEGFQKYSDFIERRLGDSFRYIQLVAQRMNSLSKRSSSARHAFESLLLHEQTLRIKSSEEAISRNTDALRNENRIIEEIQILGEALLIVCLIPYYLGHSAAAIWKAFFPALCSNAEKLGEIQDYAIEGLFTLFFFGAATMYQAVSIKNKPTNSKKTAEFWSALLMALAVLTLYALGSEFVWLPWEKLWMCQPPASK